MIARQMQPGLDRLFKELGKEFEKPLPALPTSSTTPISIRRRSSVSLSIESLGNSFRSSISNGVDSDRPRIIELGDEEEAMRTSTETAVTAAIDLFQGVDKSQLSLLGATTNLTGITVEKMIERYVIEQIHDAILFPKLTSIRNSEDNELNVKIRQMADIDASQVGLPIGKSRRERQALADRLSKGVDAFKEMSSAGSPQEMLHILLQTLKLITLYDGSVSPSTDLAKEINDSSTPEKQDALLTINADTLVSLLLVVVIRAGMRNLRARLAYMRHFNFIDDVENGELGYSLSTFEAVLSYLSRDAGSLRKASRKNRKLWYATKSGNVADMRHVLEPETTNDYEEDLSIDDHEPVETNGLSSRPNESSFVDSRSWGGTTINGASEAGSLPPAPSDDGSEPQSSLSHVFPFQRPPTPPPTEIQKVRKRVSMETRSTSSSSGYSAGSLADTLATHISARDADTSIEKLAMTQSPTGESVLMMAVECGQEKALQYLLSLKRYYPLDVVLDDETNDGTTLLGAAVQNGRHAIADLLLGYLFDNTNDDDKFISRDRILKADASPTTSSTILTSFPASDDSYHGNSKTKMAKHHCLHCAAPTTTKNTNGWSTLA